MNQDQEHLRLLGIFHYVMAGIACLLPLLSLIYIGMGVAMLSGKFPSSPPSPHPDLVSGWIFVGFGGFMFVAGLVGAILNFLVARALAKRERRNLCLVVACLNCLHMPLGTLLGVFTLVVLGRPTVKALFEIPAQGAVAGGWQPPGPAYPARAPGTSPFSNPNP